MFAVAPPIPSMGEAWLDVLDVGNGLAVVVRTAGHALVYDAGPSWNADADSGNRIVVPFLRGEGVARLDALVISHADDDHAGGAASIVESREPRWLFSSLPASDPLHEAVDHSARCESGQQWSWDGVAFSVLHPAAAIYADAGKRKENDRSCVLKVSTQAAAALLTGDVEARGESEMLSRNASALGADILLVPHHGSKTSSTAPFIAAVNPTVALFSVGHRNRFRHPNEGVVARYAERGIVLRRTDAEGALHVRLPAESGLAATVQGQGSACRYWTERPCP
jgi:competence protein ComEC